MYDKPLTVTALKSVCPLINLGSTCWLNATLQDVHKSFVCRSLLFQMAQCDVTDVDNSDVCVGKAHSDVNLLHYSIFEILDFTVNNSPKPVSVNYMKKCITLYGKLHPQKRITIATQHDVHEFLTDCFFNLLEAYNLYSKICHTTVCSNCRLTNVSSENCPCIILSVPEQPTRATVQQLLTNYWQSRTVEADCDSIVCQNSSAVKKILVFLHKRPTVSLYC